MKYAKTKKELVFRVIGDVLYIGVQVGAIVICWKAIGKVNKTGINLVWRIIITNPLADQMVESGFDIWNRSKKIKKRIKNYYTKKIEEQQEKANELVKQFEGERIEQTEENVKTVEDFYKLNGNLDKTMKELEKYGFDASGIEEFQNELQEVVKELTKEWEEIA